MSTGHREEAEQLLSETLTDLGVQPTEGVVTCVLQRLRQVSGRLALRTFGSSSSRREATALAIAIDHLLKSGELEESVLIPVDSHMEVFSPVKRRGRPEKSRRCDLLSVSLTKTGILQLSLFEVKGRSHRPSPDVFATICDQLQTTQTLLEALWCDESRTDRDLQLYRLRQILEYHLRRACGFGTVSDISRWHPTLEKLAAGEIQIEMSMHGIVVCPRAMPETVQRGEIEIRVIGEVELTTITNDSEETLPVQDAFVPKLPPGAPPPTTRSSGHDQLPETNPNASTGTSLPVATVPKSKKNDQNPELDAEQDFGVGNVFGTAFGKATENRNIGVEMVNDHSTPTAEEDSRPQESDLEDMKAPEATAPNQQSGLPKLHEIPLESVNDAKKMDLVSPPPEQVEQDSSSDNGEAASGGVEVVMGDGHDGPVTWKPAVAGSPHLFIIGIPGQGKSVTTTRLLCELTKQNVPALVLDFHGEFAKPEGPFAQLADPNIMDAADGLPFSILEPKHGKGPRAKEAIWELAEICQYVCGLGDIQRDALYRSFELAYASVPDGSTPLLKEVGALIQDDEQDGNTKNVIARCRPLFEFGLFADSPSEAIYDQFRKGAVIDLHHLKSETLQLAAGAFTLRKLYRAMFSWGPAKRIRLAIVLDEAHRLAKDLTLPRIMKEGRKFGVAVVVASQDVRDFHDQVLSNAGTKVVFRVNYPDSRKVAGFVRADRGETLSSKIERLAVGEAVMQTPDMPTADWVRMRQVDD